MDSGIRDEHCLGHQSNGSHYAVANCSICELIEASDHLINVCDTGQWGKYEHAKARVEIVIAGIGRMK